MFVSMTEKYKRTLSVAGGSVECLAGKMESIEKCRFCVHSAYFIVNKKMIKSPARAFCTFVRSGEDVSLSDVEAVVCDDEKFEGYRSIMNIIS